MATKLAGQSAVRRARPPSRTPSPLVPVPRPPRPRLRRVSVLGVRAASWLVKRSPAAAVLRLPPVRAWRLRMIVMDADDVLEVVDALERAGVPAWLVGGWGVDALLGEKTRRHQDVDVAISAAGIAQRRTDRVRAQHALEPLGYRIEADYIHLAAWLPERTTFRDRAGRTIDLLPIDVQDDGFFTTGTIGGRRVPCISPEVQLLFHSGYEPRPEDRHDIDALCRRFDLTLPAPSRGHAPGWR